MEFDEMKKIWDTQNNEPMYAINEAALHQRIRAKGNFANKMANWNEIGLILITIVTSTILIIDAIADQEGLIDYLGAIAFLLIGVYILMGRIRRKRGEHQYDRSMLGDLDHAIANVNYLVTMARTFVWWFLAPAAFFCLLSMLMSDAPLWKWIMIMLCFPLSYVLVRFELNRIHLPKKRELEALRNKLRD